jgi:hypothetical protein
MVRKTAGQGALGETKAGLLHFQVFKSKGKQRTFGIAQWHGCAGATWPPVRRHSLERRGQYLGLQTFVLFETGLWPMIVLLATNAPFSD